MDVTGQTRTGNQPAMVDETAAPPDILYVVREGNDNESLRYSLRSLVNIPHRNVFISGGRPDWVCNVNHIYKPLGYEVPDQQDSNQNLLNACCFDELSDDFIFMNDDFFIMQPVNRLPLIHQGPLEDTISRYKRGNRFHQAYSLIKTQQALLGAGYGPELLSAELHMPMMMNKHKVIAMFDWFDGPLFAMRPRTMYHNLYKLNGTLTPDAKESSNPKSRFLSSAVDFNASRTGELVRAKFRDPSPYES